MVPHDALPGERHWFWYRIRHCQVKYTGCGTAWHIARLHWSWYHIAHCQVKYTRSGTVWHIPRLHWLWYRIAHCQVKYTGRGTIWHNVSWNTLVVVPWHIARCEALVVVPYDTLLGTSHWSWYRQVGNEYKISTNSETMKVFDNIYAFVSIVNARLLTSMWLIIRLG